MFDHDDGIRAAWHHPARGDDDGVARADDGRGYHAGVNRFVGQTHATRSFLGCAERVFGDDGVAIDVRPVERRNVDGRHDVSGQHAGQRLVECDALDSSRCQVEGGTEAALGFVAVEHLQELLLLTHSATPPPQRLRRSPRCRRRR